MVRSYSLREIIAWDFHVPEEDDRHFIKQQDNQLFRLIRKITKTSARINKYVIFVDSGGCSKTEDHIRTLVFDGIYVQNRHYVFGERSASMTRNGIFSFVREDVAEKLNECITMDIQFDKTVLSKYYAYRGLFFSSCHCFDNWRPKIIVVADKEMTIPQQNIKYLVDEITPFTDDSGQQREWKQKGIAQQTCDVEINAFDGCGICHPDIAKELTELLGAKYPVTSYMVRFPYVKGLIHSIDYELFWQERDVEFIQDVWGKWHSIHDKMIIMTESMYKGLKYFKKYGDSRDWDRYWDKFDKYGHCIGIAKWNFAFDEEPIYTRSNYQILQDLDLDYDEFRDLADESVTWAEKIIDEDPVSTMCFLGLVANRCSPVNSYAKAVVKNPEMLKERSVRKYLMDTLRKNIDEMKCGKLWLESSFKILAPDLIMLMEHVGGMDCEGCLTENEFWSQNINGVFDGKHLIERNPHICRSEHATLTAVSNSLTKKYVEHLANVCMVNAKSLIAQRLNGADYDCNWSRYAGMCK